MNPTNEPAPQQTTTADLTPDELGKLRELGLKECDRSINAHGAVKDPVKARQLLMEQISYAGGVPWWGNTTNADAALRKLPPSIFAVPGAPGPDVMNMTQAQYNKARRSTESQRLTGLSCVTGSGH